MDIGWYIDGYRMIQPVKSVAATTLLTWSQATNPRISYPQLVSLQKPFSLAHDDSWFWINKNLSGICVFGPSSWGNPMKRDPIIAISPMGKMLLEPNQRFLPGPWRRRRWGLGENEPYKIFGDPTFFWRNWPPHLFQLGNEIHPVSSQKMGRCLIQSFGEALRYSPEMLSLSEGCPGWVVIWRWTHIFVWRVRVESKMSKAIDGIICIGWYRDFSLFQNYLNGCDIFWFTQT